MKAGCAFTKLASSMLLSTIWLEDDPTRIVWVTILMLADRWGRVAASVPGLAGAANVSVEATEKALEKFTSPDPYSRSKKAGGRRLEKIEGGWFIINHPAYREMRDEEARLQYKLEWTRKKRSQKKPDGGQKKSSRGQKKSSNGQEKSSKGQLRTAEDQNGQLRTAEDQNGHIADADADADTEKERGAAPPTPPAGEDRAKPASGNSETRDRDLIWEALVRVQGTTPDRVTKTIRGRANECKRDIQILTPDVTAEEIMKRYANMQDKFATVSYTVLTLKNNWPEFSEEKMAEWRRARVMAHEQKKGPRFDGRGSAPLPPPPTSSMTPAERAAADAARLAAITKQMKLDS
jgi:hypothetical protein